MKGYKSLSEIASILDPLFLNNSSCISLVCNYLANDYAPNSFIFVTPEDNQELDYSGLLLVPKGLFRELEIYVSSEEVSMLFNIVFQILHPLATKQNGSDVFYLTFEEYEQRKIEEYKALHFEDDEFKNLMHKVRLKEKYRENIPEHLKATLLEVPIEKKIKWPSGYVKGGRYFRLFKRKQRMSPKELMDAGFPQAIALSASLHSTPEPKWAKIGAGVFTATKKTISFDKIFLPENSDLELLMNRCAAKTAECKDSQLQVLQEKELSERKKLYRILEQALNEGRYEEKSTIDERISLIMKDNGYSYEQDHRVVRSYAYVLADEKAVIKNPLKKIENIDS